MKIIDNLFSSLYLFFEAIDDGRPGNSSIVTLRFYRRRRYLNIITRCKEEKRKGIYYFITLVYISLTLIIFVNTR